MRIDVTHLVQGPNALALEEMPAAIGLPVPGPDGSREDAPLGAVFVGPVRARLQVTRTGDEFLIDAELAAPAELECSRCLAWAPATIAASFRSYVRREESASGVRSFAEQLDEGGVVAFWGRFLEIGEAAREALLLAVPMKQLCREDCLGLCPGCGADLNTEPCTCAARAAAGSRVAHPEPR